MEKKDPYKDRGVVVGGGLGVCGCVWGMCVCLALEDLDDFVVSFISHTLKNFFFTLCYF